MTMIKQERLDAIKKQALAAIAARANNPKAPGVSMVAVSPHECLKLLEAYQQQNGGDDVDKQ